MIEEQLEFRGSDAVITRIKKDDVPLYIWGCGTTGLNVKHYLEENGVGIKGVFVDGKYWSLGSELDGMAVNRLEDVLSHNEKISVVMGLADYSKGEQLKSKSSLIKEVYYITSPGYMMTESLTKEDVERHLEKYDKTWHLVEDQLSRDVFISWLNARINDDATYVFPYYTGNMGYFKNDIYSIGSNEGYIDIGAYNGDSIKRFIECCNGKYSHIWAIEADDTNYEALIACIEKNEYDDITPIRRAVWSKKGRGIMNPVMGNPETVMVSFDQDKGDKELFTVDEIADEYSIESSLIKINFPGADYVLRGACRLIQRDHPKIAVRVGFNKYEIGIVPELIKEIYAGYKLYLRYNYCVTSGLCLYAVCDGD